MDSDMSDIQKHIRHLMINRHSPEAIELYTMLMRYIYKRVFYITKTCGSDRMSTAEVEDLVSEVMLQLINGSLAQFRGQSVPELIGFVRTVTDRRIWRTRTRRIQNQEMLKRLRSQKPDFLMSTLEAPDAVVEFDSETLLSEEDERYLEALIRAGSKAEYARQLDKSRAAITQRVKRIVGRIEALASADQLAVDSWLQRVARRTLAESPLKWSHGK
jgi:hypothetical protein